MGKFKTGALDGQPKEENCSLRTMPNHLHRAHREGCPAEAPELPPLPLNRYITASKLTAIKPFRRHGRSGFGSSTNFSHKNPDKLNWLTETPNRFNRSQTLLVSSANRSTLNSCFRISHRSLSLAFGGASGDSLLLPWHRRT